jgi:signal transduction histidine kinase
MKDKKNASLNLIIFNIIKFIYVTSVAYIIFVNNSKYFEYVAPVIIIFEILNIFSNYINKKWEIDISSIGSIIAITDISFLFFILIITHNNVLFLALALISYILNFLIYNKLVISLEIFITALLLFFLGVIYLNIVYILLALIFIIIGVSIYLYRTNFKKDENTDIKPDIITNEKDETVDIKDEFTIIVSHNLRTPIATLKGYLQLIEYTNDEELKQNYLNLLKNNVNKLYLLTEEVLGIINNTKTSDSKTNVNLVISALIERFDEDLKSKRIEINVKSDSQNTEVNVGEYRLKIILGNIIENAIKFSHLNSQIDINIYHIQDKGLSIKIRDYGTGIEKEALKNIFQKYHKTDNVLNSNFEGLGLGLYIVKSLINDEKGQIVINSEKGKGTEVEIVFPL